MEGPVPHRAAGTAAHTPISADGFRAAGEAQASRVPRPEAVPPVFWSRAQRRLGLAAAAEDP